MGRQIDRLALGRLERPPLYDRLSCGYLPWQAGLFSSLLSLEVLVDPSPRIGSLYWEWWKWSCPLVASTAAPYISTVIWPTLEGAVGRKKILRELFLV